MEDNQEQVKIELAILEQKLENLKPIIVKIDAAIEKLSEVNTTVSRMLAVHEERISNQEEVDKLLFAKVDKLRDKVDVNNDSLLSRLQSLEKKIWITVGCVSTVTVFFSNPSFFLNLTQPVQQPIINRDMVNCHGFY